MVEPSPNDRLRMLYDSASQVEIIHGLNIQQYFRAMRGMIVMTETYVHANKIENAYYLASKFSILFLKHLPQHRDYASVSKSEKTVWNRRCKAMLNLAEELKADLRKKYEEEHRLAQAEREARERQKPSTTNHDDSEQAVIELKSFEPDSPVTDPGKVHPALPAVDRSLKPRYLLDQFDLSVVRVPLGLMDRFLEIARPNTLVNKETCGILCGVMCDNEFVITNLAIPKQSGTSDSCITTNEEEIFDHTDKKGLIVVGWIHTHPTQTAFLSSVDQHSQLSYQMMLREAIAIVCAPKFDEKKIFSLTSDYGLQVVRDCRLEGFHPHPHVSPLFEESRHAVLDPSVNFDVTDLRR